MLRRDGEHQASAAVWLMSLAPTWAWLTLDGVKRAELRRGGCRFEAGDRVLVYETSPVAAVTGVLWVRAVERVPVDDLCEPKAVAEHRVRPGAVRAYAGDRPELTVIRWAHFPWPLRLPGPMQGTRGRTMPRRVTLAELRAVGVTPSPTWVRATSWLAYVTGAGLPWGDLLYRGTTVGEPGSGQPPAHLDSAAVLPDGPPQMDLPLFGAGRDDVASACRVCRL